MNTSHEVWLRASSREHLRRLYEIAQDGMRKKCGKPATILSSTSSEQVFQVVLYSVHGDVLRSVMQHMERQGFITIRTIDVTHL